MASTTAGGGGAPPTYATVFTNAKAGMEGVDKERVKRLVYEMSKDSPHFLNEQRKMAATEERVGRMRAAAAALSRAALARHAAAADAQLAELEAGRDLSRTWLHVDMDAFFASVEELDNPSLRGRPFAVGGLGMISTASYAARKFGVRSAMPGFIALRLCPDLVFVPCSFDKYRSAAERTRAVFAAFDPSFQAASLDEASLDVTQVCADRGMTGETARPPARPPARPAASAGVQRPPHLGALSLSGARRRPGGGGAAAAGA
jgi:hypothetical protein